MASNTMRVAILGNGQLATMLQENAGGEVQTRAFNLPRIHADGSCDQTEINTWVDTLRDFDVVTYEIENIPVVLLEAVKAQVPVYPPVEALAMAQDRLCEKNRFCELGINTNAFYCVDSEADLQAAAAALGYPFVLKRRRFGYDGKGQMPVYHDADLAQAWETLGGAALIAEAFIAFDYEVSQVASRDAGGNIVFYPLVQNVHREGILRETWLLPAPCQGLVEQAQRAICRLMTHFQYVGTMAVEFFVQGENLLANETAPRVHNSGHWSLDGALASQFENHMRAISGKPLKAATPRFDYVLMVNLIGEDCAPEAFDGDPHIHVKSYGKAVRPGRKIGHITITADEPRSFARAVARVYAHIKAAPGLDFSGWG